MLPEAQDSPTCVSQGATYLPVPDDIGLNFCFPVVAPHAWQPTMLRTSVPETSVNKDNNTSLRKDKVWFAFKGESAPPAADPVSSQDPDQG
jgi:hypothetical protein